mgnify:CR=1 FL=1
MLKKIEDNLNKKESTWLDQLSLKQSDPKSDLPKAAVLIALTDEENPEVIYTLRSNKVSSHQGEVSFPGGMQEESDTSLIITALRESEEEIGLPQNCVKILGSLDTMYPKNNRLVNLILNSLEEGCQVYSTFHRYLDLQKIHIHLQK